MNEIIFKQSNAANFRFGRTDSIKFIVIHFTANNGDTAKNNADYFARENAGASAHYFVDEYDKIYQSVKDTDTAWHCGGGLQGSGGHGFYKICTNSNSIGIEMCSRKNGNFYIKPETVDSTLDLTKFLTEKYNIPLKNVIRHYDVTGKNCPEPFVRNGNLWEDFKNKLSAEGLTMSQYEELKSMILELKNKMIYNYIDDNMPLWARPTVQKLVDKGYLQGDENGELGLDDGLLRMLVINDRAGIYDTEA